MLAAPTVSIVTLPAVLPPVIVTLFPAADDNPRSANDVTLGAWMGPEEERVFS